MKEKVLYIVLGFSLGLNLSLGGAFLWGWMNQRSGPAGMDRTGSPGPTMPPALQRKLEKAREPWIPEFKRLWDEVHQARRGLYEALREQPPDPQKIRERLDQVAEIQKTHQAMVVDRILKETESMNPEERGEYLEWIGRGMQCPGMGPGRGGRRPGRDRALPAPLHPGERGGDSQGQLGDRLGGP